MTAPETSPGPSTESSAPFRLEDLPRLSPPRVLRPPRPAATDEPSSSAPPRLPLSRAPLSEAEAARMTKIKEEAFDEEGYFKPGWREQFVGAPPPPKIWMPVDRFLFRDGEVLFPPAELKQNFELMQSKFSSFSNEFGRLLHDAYRMSQVLS